MKDPCVLEIGLVLKSCTEHSEKCVKYSCRKGKEAGSRNEGEVSTIQFEVHISRKQVNTDVTLQVLIVDTY